jgi:hypothetical protein
VGGAQVHQRLEGREGADHSVLPNVQTNPHSIQGLPAKGQPEEWSRFLSKARLGVRNHQSIPNVKDATEFGIAIVNWVKAFTPPDFGRTGPHGFVSLLTLLAWWGTAALTPPSWNDDSCPQWQEAVWNLLSKLDQHLNSPVPSKRASNDDNQDSGKENKQSVIGFFIQLSSTDRA